MLLYLQIALTILSALCVALVMPLGVWLGWTWAIVLALAAVAFFMLMKICKQTREFRGETDNFDNSTDGSTDNDEQKNKNEEQDVTENR